MRATILGGLTLFLVAFGGDAAAQPGGAPPSGAASPLARLSTVLDAFHMRDGRPDEQMEAVHRCGHVTPDLIQCALFDGIGADAKLIGIEYVITAKVLAGLSPDERKLWHSHAFEVKSGQLTAVGMSPSDEHELMKMLVNTYGKTWHTWEMGQSLPTGRPQLMMSFTRDGQVRADLVERRDRSLGMSTAALRARRADIAAAPIAAGVDQGEGGRSCMAPTRASVKGALHP
jgi:hypothetical protein